MKKLLLVLALLAVIAVGAIWCGSLAHKPELVQPVIASETSLGSPELVILTDSTCYIPTYLYTKENGEVFKEPMMETAGYYYFTHKDGTIYMYDNTDSFGTAEAQIPDSLSIRTIERHAGMYAYVHARRVWIADTTCADDVIFVFTKDGETTYDLTGFIRLGENWEVHYSLLHK